MAGEQDYQNQEQDRRIRWLEDHYSTFNNEMGTVQKCVGEMKTDLTWIKKMLWWVVATMIGGFGAIFSVIVYHIYVSK